MSTDAERLSRLEAHVEAAEVRIKDLEADRKSLFRWGLMSLGSLITAIIGFLLRDHIK